MDDMGKPLMEIFFCKDEAKKVIRYIYNKSDCRNYYK